jgi:hypothetical protein
MGLTGTDSIGFYAEGGDMRRLAWVSGLISVVAGGWGVAAQEQPSAAAIAGPPLEAWMLPSVRTDLQFGLSDPAYLAVFEIFPGRGVEMLYPESFDAGMHAAGEFYVHPTYLVDGDEEREIAFTGHPYTGFPPCYLLVASRSPLHVSQYTTHALALSEALHQQIPSIGHPLAVLGAVLKRDLPADSANWATDMYCEPGEQLAGLELADVARPLSFLNPGETYFGGSEYNSFELGSLGWQDPEIYRVSHPDVRQCYSGTSPGSATEAAVPLTVCGVQARAPDEVFDCDRSSGSDIAGCGSAVLPRREPQPSAETASGGRLIVPGQRVRIGAEAFPVSRRAASVSADNGSPGPSRGSGNDDASSSSSTATAGRGGSSGGTSNGSRDNSEHSGNSGAASTSAAASASSNAGTSNEPSSAGASNSGGGYGGGSSSSGAGGVGGGTGGGGNGGNAGASGGGRPGGRP